MHSELTIILTTCETPQPPPEAVIPCYLIVWPQALNQFVQIQIGKAATANATDRQGVPACFHLLECAEGSLFHAMGIACDQKRTKEELLCGSKHKRPALREPIKSDIKPGVGPHQRGACLMPHPALVY